MFFFRQICYTCLILISFFKSSYLQLHGVLRETITFLYNLYDLNRLPYFIPNLKKKLFFINRNFFSINSSFQISLKKIQSLKPHRFSNLKSISARSFTESLSHSVQLLKLMKTMKMSQPRSQLLSIFRKCFIISPQRKRYDFWKLPTIFKSCFEEKTMKNAQKIHFFNAFLMT